MRVLRPIVLPHPAWPVTPLKMQHLHSGSVQIGRDQRPELDYLAAHRFAAGLDPALRHQLLDVADAQREPEIPAYRQQDHRRREPVTLEIDWGFTLLPALTT